MVARVDVWQRSAFGCGLAIRESLGNKLGGNAGDGLRARSETLGRLVLFTSVELLRRMNAQSVWDHVALWAAATSGKNMNRTVRPITTANADDRW